MISLSHTNSELTIDPNGGRIVELILDNTPLLGTFTRIDGKQANTHICTPNFGNEGVEKYNLPPHGPGRSEMWEIISETDTTITLLYDMPKIGSYPTSLSITQVFDISEASFIHTVEIKNTGDEMAPVNIALHYYFHTPQGWQDLMINDVKRADKIMEDTSIDAKPDNAIGIPGIKPFTLSVGDDFSKLQTWTAREEKNGKLAYSQDFACIEPVIGTDNYFGSLESMLGQNQSKKVICTMSI